MAFDASRKSFGLSEALTVRNHRAEEMPRDRFHQPNVIGIAHIEPPSMIFSNQGSEGRRALPMRFASLSLWAGAASQTKSMISRLNVNTASVAASSRRCAEASGETSSDASAHHQVGLVIRPKLGNAIANILAARQAYRMTISRPLRANRAVSLERSSRLSRAKSQPKKNELVNN